MTLDPRFQPLFQPLRIGPVTAPNRFWQVPHCSGMGYTSPQTLAAMREVKAEGGWGVVNTEYCSIHPSSDDMPAPFCSLWDDGDVAALAAVTDGIHRHGALAGVELWHGGIRAPNRHSRLPGLGPVSLPASGSPWQCQVMDRADIQAYRGWHQAAVERALRAGFDVVYVYACHTYLLAQFLDPMLNQRQDDYGLTLEGRWRLVREVVEDTRALVDGRAALAMRVEVVDEDGGNRDARAAMLASLAPLIDVFDVTIPDYSIEMGTSRFVKEAALEAEVAHVRQATGRPVVSVGRFTSPETMVRQIRDGVLDFIGAARPSIADPFLPAKIREGRLQDIRECIGCNICYSNDTYGVPIHCTQNPTMGEEWRRGWHPERVAPLPSRPKVLIVGAGPAGLEAAVTLGRRGAEVTLAEAGRMLGGRVTREAQLPGLSEWARVRDWRVQQLEQLPTVTVYRQSHLSADEIIALGPDHVVLATGARWRRDGVGRSLVAPVEGLAQDPRTLDPDQVMAGQRPGDPAAGPVIVYDDDHYYLAGCLAQLLAQEGHAVTYVTTAGVAAAWTEATAEQAQIQSALIAAGVEILVSQQLVALAPGVARLACVYGGRRRDLPCGTIVPVTARLPVDALWHALRPETAFTLHRIGDCLAPGIIAQAVASGHRLARGFEALALGAAEAPIRRERPPGGLALRGEPIAAE